MRIALLGSILSITLLLAGCGSQPGKSIVKWDGTADRLTDAPSNARYALYSGMGTNPDISYSLNKGEQVGFVTQGDKVFAVAGQHKDEIKKGKTYYWKMQKE
jgi:hypothetical protein